MDERKQKMEDISNAILSSARNELYVAMRFLDVALHALSFQMNLSTKSIGTDGISILYNPAYLARNYRDDRIQINRAYLHMLLHGMFCHMTHIREKEPMFWNLACDVAVESILDTLEYPCIRRVVTDERQEIYDSLRGELPVLTAEGIYKVLRRRQMSYGEAAEWSRLFLADDHSFWENLRDQKKPDGMPPGVLPDGGKTPPGRPADSKALEISRRQREELEKKWKDIADKTQTHMETFSKGAAQKAGVLSQVIRVQNRGKQDYGKFLRRFAIRREEIKLDADTFDYGFYSYGMRVYGNMPLLEPVEWKEEKKIRDFAIAVDTSGSCSGRLISRFLEETYRILTETEHFFQKVRIHLIQCDAAIQRDDVITSLEQMKDYADHFQVKGFGGTDFRPVFSYIDELRQKGELRNMRGLIYFTDGYGEYPKKRPDFDTAFVFVGECRLEERVPPWAMSLILDEGEEKINEY